MEGVGRGGGEALQILWIKQSKRKQPSAQWKPCRAPPRRPATLANRPFIVGSSAMAMQGQPTAAAAFRTILPNPMKTYWRCGWVEDGWVGGWLGWVGITSIRCEEEPQTPAVQNVDDSKSSHTTPSWRTRYELKPESV